jgi:REP element-mobilizing transposase RayT
MRVASGTQWIAGANRKKPRRKSLFYRARLELRSSGFDVSPGRKPRVNMRKKFSEPRSGDTSMAHTYTINLAHCVFSTKGRLPLIREPEKVWSVLRAVARNSQVNIHAIGGTTNHVHLLLEIPKTRAIADVIRELKANSSLRLRKESSAFAWQDGYGAISVSPSAVGAVTRYIEHQPEHHRTAAFDEEYVSILNRAGVKYDPQYVLD